MISLIIPTLNEEAHIASLLRFLTKHPKRDQFEIIVVDGGSDDQTVSIIQSFNVKLLVTQTSSRALQMNKGAELAQGEILYFVHADVQLVSSFVDDIQEQLANGFRSGCYRFKFLNPSNPLLFINGFFTRFAFIWCRGGDQTLFVSKSEYDQVGGFDERYVIMEDYNFLDRLRESGVPFKVIPKSVKVSARKYDTNSYMRVQLANYKAMKMYKQGVDPQLIKNFYEQALR